MGKEENGGPAFPFHVAETEARHPYGWEGMTLRDYFAAQVICGMAARDCYDPGQATPADRASLAYIEADAMLEARKR